MAGLTPVVARDSSRPRGFARRPTVAPFLVGAGLASLALYLVLAQASVELVSAEPTYAWRIFPWVQAVTRESLDVARHQVASTDVVAAHTGASAVWLAAVTGLMALYGLVLWTLDRRGSSAATIVVLGFGSVFLVMQLASPAMPSTDVYSYIIYGRVHGIYGGDAYVDLPASYPGDPYLALVYWKYVPSYYGPLWTLLSAGLARWGGDDVAFTVLLFRCTAVAGALAVGAMIWLLSRVMAPGRGSLCLAVWLWNPLLVVESGMGGHNEGIMLAPLLLACWLALRGRLVIAGAALTAGALVKVVALLAALPILVYELRGRPWRVGLGRVGSLGAGWLCLTLVLSLIVRTGPETLAVGALGSSEERYTNSVHELLLVGLRLALGETSDDARAPLHFRGWWVSASEQAGLWSASGPPARLIATIPVGTALYALAPPERGFLRVADPALRLTGYVPFTATAPLAALDAEREPDGRSGPPMQTSPIASTSIANAAIRVVGWLGFLVLCAVTASRIDSPVGVVSATAVLLVGFIGLLATWVWPWYLLWPLGFAALAPSSRIARLVIVLTAGVLTIYPATGYQGSEHWWVYNLRAIPAFVLPVVVFLIWERLRRPATTS